MKNFYEINLNKLRQDENFLKAVLAIEKALVSLQIDYYLIGALARDMWFQGVNDIKPKRATSDIDFAILLQNKSVFDQLKKYLIEKEGFSEYKENPYVLITPNKIEIDLLPFGEIEEDGKVVVSGTGMTTILVDGLNEVYNSNIPVVNIDDKISFKVCPLAGIVLLKLIAYDDRPESRVHDLTDIADIFKYYFTINDSEIWENHSDLFIDEMSLEFISARVIGREIGKILESNLKLKDRIISLLNSDENKNFSMISQTIALHLNNTIENSIKLLQEIVSGIEDNHFD